MALLSILKKHKQYKEAGKNFDTIAPFIEKMTGGQSYLFARECFKYNFKNGELTMPLMVCVDAEKKLTRYATERENWLLWDLIKNTELAKQVKNVKISQYLFCIPTNAFNNVDGKLAIEKVDMSKSQVVYIGQNAFAGNKGLELVKLSNFTSVIDKNAFTNTNIGLLHLNKPKEFNPWCKHLADRSVKRFGSIKPIKGNLYLNFPIDNSTDKNLELVVHTEDIKYSNLDNNKCIFRFVSLPKEDNKFIYDVITRGKYVLTNACRIMLHYSNNTTSVLACDAALTEHILSQTDNKDGLVLYYRNNKRIIENANCYVDDKMVDLAMKFVQKLENKSHMSSEELEFKAIKYMAQKVDTILLDQKEKKNGYTIVWGSSHDVPAKSFSNLQALDTFNMRTNRKIGDHAFESSSLRKLKGNASSIGSLAFLGTTVDEIKVNDDCEVGFQGLTSVKRKSEVKKDLPTQDICIISPDDEMGDDD